MERDPEQSGWREWLSLYSNLFRVGGGIVAVVSSILWLVGWLSGPLFLITMSVASTLFVVWLMGHVFVSNNRPIESLGSLSRDDAKEVTDQRLKASSAPSKSAPDETLHRQFQQPVSAESTQLSFECVRARMIDVEIEVETLEIALKATGKGIQGKAAIVEFRRDIDTSRIDRVYVTNTAEFVASNGDLVLINPGPSRWLDDWRGSDSRITDFQRLDTKRLALVLAISPNKVYTYEGHHGTGVDSRNELYYPFRQEFQELTESFYDVKIRLVGTEGSKVVADSVFYFELMRGPELSDITFREKKRTKGK